MGGFKLRDYQEGGVNACMDILLSEKNIKAVVVAPTGGGKSIYISEAAERLNLPLLVLQPTKELLKQNFSKYIKTGHRASICCASLKTKQKNTIDYTTINGIDIRCRDVGKVTYATPQTAMAEIDKLKTLGIKHAIIDEAHLHSSEGSTTRKLLKKLNITHVVGLTATPIYLKGGGEGSRLVMMNRAKATIFPKIQHVTQIKELVENGWWTPFKYNIIKTDESNLELNTSGSDYTEFSQKEYYKANELEGQVVEEVYRLKRNDRKRILIFVPSIAEADSLYKKIPNSAVIHSKLDTKTRDFFVDAFSSGKIPVAINVNVLATGYDNPEIDAIITTRPTASIALFYQQIGRGCRIHPEKEDCIIVDFSGNTSRFGRVEGLTFEEIPYYGWGLFNEKGQLLSDYAIQTTIKPTKDSLVKACKEELEELEREQSVSPKIFFGKHEGLTIKQAVVKDKKYCIWMYEDFKFKTPMMINIKRHLEKELMLPRTV